MGVTQSLIGLANTVGDWFARKGKTVMEAIPGTKAGNQGSPWPPLEHLARLRRYERNLNLYLGEHGKVFLDAKAEKDIRFKKDPNRPLVVAKLCGRLTDLLVSRTFGEGLTVSAPGNDLANQYFAHFEENNDIEMFYQDAGTQASYAGETWAKLWYSGDERRIVLELVQPSCVFPNFHPLDQRRMIGATIAQVLRQGDAAYLWFQGHEIRDGRSWITNRLYKLEGDVEKGEGTYHPEKEPLPLETLPQTAELVPETPTGIADLLLVHLPNRRVPGLGFWGLSDYQGLENLQGELDNRLTHRAQILDKHADPAMYGPRFDTEESSGKVKMGPGEGGLYVEVSPEDYGGSAPIGYVTWDASLQSTEKAIEDYIELFAVGGGVDISAMRPHDTGGPVSGRALKLLQLMTQATVTAKQRTLTTPIRRLYSLATKLANADGVALGYADKAGKPPIVEPQELVVEWNDGLPSDRGEEIDEAETTVRAGLDSRKRSVMRLWGLSEEDADTLLGEIAGDLVQTMGGGFAGPTGQAQEELGVFAAGEE